MLVAASLLAGCGFTLRGAPALPDDLDYVLIVSARQHAPLKRALVNQLDIYGLEGGTRTNVAPVERQLVISLAPEQLERRLLSVYSSGQVAEYELIYGVNYTVTFPGFDPVSSYFEVLRDYQDDPDQVLAKSRELDLVLSEMREEAADRIIRRLSTQAARLGTGQ
ncbi:LPS-assembly lipoprotein LptE [Alteromonas halophila]|uniref:LPS-assembly lipoprotein LptE n=2 Tax=Alteromonas halophila TaxID=516698 RepID=A0A918JG16_9ALTE|nr:LPS-assembly lipoprotein LptE [Alteromonas halophila]